MREVPGGEFTRQDDGGNTYRAAVRSFVLDRFEVTVGRFRKFVEAYPGSRPRVGAGEHPWNEQSGWPAGWERYLPSNAADLRAALRCGARATWTEEPGDNENLPMNCLTWFEAFAFCAWDQGWLPTEAEWHHAAAGGREGRVYPWSTDPTSIDTRHAVYDCTAEEPWPGSCTAGAVQIAPVGSLSPRGDGKWEQADLAGNLREWTLDTYRSYPPTCNDCLVMGRDEDARVIRGGSFRDGASKLFASAREAVRPTYRDETTGVRCARSRDWL